MTVPSTSFLDLPLSVLDEAGTVRLVAEAINGERPPLMHSVLNASKVVMARHDPGFRRTMQAFDVVNADGMSVVWAARVLGLPHVPRIPGIDLMQTLLRRAEAERWSVFLLGATDDVLRRLQAELSRRHPHLTLAGMRNGYFSAEQDSAVAAEVAASGADLLFVGTPSPKKERFLIEQRAALGVPFAMGVGGSFDVLAGEVRRAPRLLQRAGLEWAFRLAQEPARLWRRYLTANSRFLYLVLRARLGRSSEA